MLKQLFSGIALVSVVFLATPPAQAARPHEPRSYKQRPIQHHQRHQIKYENYDHC